MCIHTCYVTLKHNNNDLSTETCKKGEVVVSESELITLFQQQLKLSKEGEFVSTLYTKKKKFNIAILPCNAKVIDEEFFNCKKLTRQKIDPILSYDEKMYVQFYCLELQEYLYFYKSLLDSDLNKRFLKEVDAGHVLQIAEECLKVVAQLADDPKNGDILSLLKQGSLEILHTVSNLVTRSQTLDKESKIVAEAIQRIIGLSSILKDTLHFVPPAILNNKFGYAKVLDDVLCGPIHDSLDGGYRYLTAVALPIERACDFLQNDEPAIMYEVLYQAVRKLENLKEIPEDIAQVAKKLQQNKIDYDVLAQSSFGLEFPLLYLQLFPNATSIIFERHLKNRKYLEQCLLAIRNNSKIEKLDFSNCPITDKDLIEVNLSSLQELDVSGTGIKGGFLESKWPQNLRCLRMNLCSELIQDNLLAFGGKELIELAVAGTPLDYEILSAPFLKSVKRLLLPRMDDVTDDDLRKLPCDEIQILSIPFALVEGVFLQDEKFKGLTHLDMSHNTKITDEVFQKMSSDSLKYLNVNGTWISPDVLTSKKFKNLESLQFNNFRKEGWFNQLAESFKIAGVQDKNIQQILNSIYNQYINVKVAESCFLVSQKESELERRELAEKLFYQFKNAKMELAARQFVKALFDMGYFSTP